MKKSIISAAILAILSSTQVSADEISGGPRANMKKRQLIVPCVLVNSPDSAIDGKYFDVKLKQRGKSLNYEVVFGEEEKEGTCAAMIEASLNADEDTTDINGDLDDDPEEEFDYDESENDESEDELESEDSETDSEDDLEDDETADENPETDSEADDTTDIE